VNRRETQWLGEVKARGDGVRDGRILVACSGGGDSLALLSFLWSVRKSLGLELVVAHADHGLRPEARAEADLVRGICRGADLDLVEAALDVRAHARATGQGLETAARELRWGWLRAQAESVAGAVTHNASFNCNAAKLLVLPRGWPQRDAFLAGVEHFLALAPARLAWYPGAQERYRALTEGRADVRRVGQGQGALPWTIVAGLDAASRDPAFTTEPFCSLLSETSLGSTDPEEYLARAVEFVNERVWGTLSAHMVVHPRTMADPALSHLVEQAIRRLRYGTVAVNVWAGYGFAFGTTPWGAYPGSALTDIQSGRGIVHNTLMLERIEKAVIRHPARTFPKPPYFPSHRTAHRLGRALVDMEARGWAAMPRVVVTGMGG